MGFAVWYVTVSVLLGFFVTDPYIEDKGNLKERSWRRKKRKIAGKLRTNDFAVIGIIQLLINDNDLTAINLMKQCTVKQ